jgi:branched-chain amino acid transport system substrate-binding protein
MFMSANKNLFWRKALTKLQAVIIIAIVVVALGVGVYFYTQYMSLLAQVSVENEIRIGISLGLSGGYAGPSQRQLWGLLMAIEDINAAGGIYVKEYGKKLPIRLIYYDDRGDSATAIKLYERLITEDKVHILLGPYGSGTTLAVAPVPEKYKVVMISQMAAADTIPAQGYKYVFTLLPVASQFGLSRLGFLDSLSPKPKTFAIVTSNELYPLTVANSTRMLLQKAGYTMVYFDTYPRGTTDFSGILLKIKPLNPDFLYFVCYPPDAFVIMEQMKGLGITPKILMFDDGPNDPKFVEVFKEEAEGVLTQMSWHWALPFPGVANFTKRFLERYGEYPRHWSAYPYAAIQVIKYAIEKAGSLDTEKIRSALLQLKGEMTLVGPVKFEDWTNPMGVKLTQINTGARNLVLQIQKGEMKIVYPKDVANAEPIYPWPGWRK